MNFCPNLSNKKIKQEFDELVSILGEDAAYLIWDRSQGNGLELAPNGASSKLFQDLLEYYKGDRRQAIIAKAKTYTNNFLNWFGDWVGVSKPQVKYYGPTMGKTTAAKTNKYLVDFDDIVRSDIKKLAEKQGKTVRQIKIESGEEYKQLLLSAIDKWRNDDNNIGKTLVISNAVLSTENIFDNTPSIPSKEEFVKRQVQRSEDVSKTKKQLKEEASQYYDDLLKRNPNLKIEDRFVSDLEIGVSKVVDENGEPLVVYHGSKYKFTVFKNKYETYKETKYIDDYEEAALNAFTEEEISILENIFKKIDDNPFIGLSELSEKEDDLYNKYTKIKKEFRENGKQIIQHYNIGNFFTTDKNYALSYGDVNFYCVFLNIKNPKESNNLHRIYTSEETIDKLIEYGYDGQIGHDVKGRDVESIGEEYFVLDSNQIKSVDNEGEYSTTNNNIYHNKDIKHLIQTYDNLLKEAERLAKSPNRFKAGWLKEFNRKNGTNFGYNPATKRIVTRGASIYGVPLTYDIESEVQPKTNINRVLLLEYLANKFNLKIKEIDRHTYDKHIGKISNCCVIGNTVYIRSGDRDKLTDEQFIEEFLHPVIHSIYSSNEKISKNLLSEAKKKFPNLCKQIEYLYKNRGQDIINEEIITQVLSKYLRKEIIDNGTNSRKLINYIHQFLEEIIRRCSDLFGNINLQKGQVLLVNGSDIRDVFSFKNLAELINSSDIQFKDTLEPLQIRDNIISDDTFVEDADDIDQLAIEEADVTWMSAKSNLTSIAQSLVESGLCTGQKTSFGSYVIQKTGDDIQSYRNTKSQITKRLNIEGYAPSFEKVKDNNGNTVTVLHSVSDISELKEDTEGYGENEEKVNRVLSFIQQRFPGLKVVWHNQNDPSVPSTSSANAWIDGDTVHLVRGRINGHVVIEEFLHPFIAVIQHEYPSLFNDLLDSAKKEFPKLCKQIEKTYDSKSKQVQENEMVTQALSRLVNTYRHDQSKLSTKLKNIVSKAVEYIQDIFNKVFEKVGISKRINISSLKDRVKTIEDLANIITSNDFVHTYNQTELIAKYQNARDESLSLKEQLTERYQRLFESYKRTPNKSKRREQIQNEIHDLLTKLRSQSDEDAVRESVAFAVQAIGLQDIIQTQPQDYIDTTNLTGEDRERAIRKNRSRNIFSFLYQEAHRSDGAPEGTTDPTYQNFSGVTADDIVNIEKHALSFYEKLYNDVISKAKIKTTEVSGLDTAMTQVRSLWQDAVKAVGDRIVDEYIDREFSNYTEQERENMKVVFKDWLHENSFHGDISEFWGGKLKNFSYSNNEIIKQMFHEIQKKNAKTMREVQPHVDRINKAWKRANGITKTFKGHWQEMMMERDRRGRYTGNFIREINYGQYVQDLEEFVKELNEEFDREYGKHYEKNDLGDWVSSTGIAIEDDDSELWGTTGDMDDDMPTFYKYLARLYDWKCRHANMRYTYDYYIERMSRPYTTKSETDEYDVVNYKNNHGLQPRTFLKYERIQSNINYYLDKCADPETGLCYVENLDEQDRLKLEMWRDQLDELSNPFNIDGTKKEGDELSDAMQIRAWQRWINERLYTKHDQDAFNEYYQQLIRQGASQEELDNFLKYNARYGISAELMDFLNSQFEKVEQGHNAINLELFKSGLYSLVRGENDFQRDLELMLDQFEFWKNCRIIQEGLQRHQAKNANNGELANKFLTKELSLSPYKTNDGQSITWADYVIEHYVQKAMTLGQIPGIDGIDFSSMSETQIRNYFHKVFYIEKIVTKKDGTIEIKENPLDIFYITFPRGEFGTGYKAIGRFKSKSNKPGYDMYVNPDYDTSSVESEQPLAYDPISGEQMYDNYAAFNKLGQPGDAVRDLYDVLIDEMKQAQQSINTHNVMFNYKLPQLNASNIAILSRIGTYGVSDTVKKMYEGFVTVQENDTEMRTKHSYITNPDESKAMSLPLRFYYDLEDKSTVATDVTGMVKLFVHMATNYKNSADIESMMKVLQYNLHRGEGKKGKNSEDLAKQLMQRHFYEDVWNDEEAVSPEDRKSTVKSYILDTIGSALGCTILGTTSGVATLGISKVFAAILGTTAGLSTFGVPFAFGIGGLTIGILASTYSHFIQNKVSNTKLYKILHRYSVLRTLGFNWLSAAVGFLDSSTRIIEEAFTGKYVNPYNLAVGIFQTLVNLPKYVFNIGNPVPNNKMTALMQLNQISKNFTETNKNTNRSRARRILGNLAMGPFGMFDWLTNQCLLRSYYSNCRFYQQVPDGPAIKTGFYTDYEFEQALNNLGLDAVTRDKYYWKYRALSTSPSLYDAYSFKDGVLEIKDKYKPYLQGDNETVLDRIYSQTHQRAGLINGMNPDNDTPAYRTSIIGAFVGSMRAWMLQNYQHLFVGGDSMSVLQKEERVTQTIHRDTTKSKKDDVYKKLTADQLDHRMCINHETGIPHDQQWIAGMHCLQKLAKLLVLIPYGKITHKKYELSKPNRNERDGLWGIFVAIAIMFGVMFATVPLVKWSYQTPAPVDYTTAKGKPQPGKTKNAKLARSESRSFYPIERQMIEDRYNSATKGTKFDLNDYGYYKYGIGKKTVADILFRTWEGKMSAIDPTQAIDIVTSVYAGFQKGIDQNFELLNVLSDVLGVSGKSPEDIVDRGSYRNYTRLEQALYRTASPINNLHTFTTYHGIDENLGFYVNKYGKFYKLFGVDVSKLKKAPEPPKKSKKKGSGKSKRGKSQHTKPGFNKPRFNKPAFNKPAFNKPRFIKP